MNINSIKKEKKKKKLSRFQRFVILLIIFTVALVISFVEFGDAYISLYQEVGFGWAALVIFTAFMLIGGIMVLKSKYPKGFNKVLNKGIPIMFFFFIPMIAVIILFMGSLHGIYKYDSSFLNDTERNLTEITAPALAHGFNLAVVKLYTLGEKSPKFYFVLSFLLTIFLFYYAWTSKWGGEEKSAEELVNESDVDKDLRDKDKKEVDMLLKGKMQERKLERMKERIEKQDMGYVEINFQNRTGQFILKQCNSEQCKTNQYKPNQTNISERRKFLHD